MIEYDRVQKILYGGDYNPEQWPEEIWEEDMKLFHEAHIDVVTLNVFSWAMLQPSENVYNFDKLDKIMELVKQNGLKVCMATSTAAHPAWMARKHPDILRTERNGIKRKFGARHNSCPNSPTYRKYSVALAEKLAERYKDYDNIVAWHISNEYGGECFCENCEKAFREWTKARYGTIDEVNRAWNMHFWGHTLFDFEDIVVPDFRSEEFLGDGTIRTTFQGISLDYARFNSDSMLECYKLEYDAVKKWTPDIPVTTNLMGAYKPLDYQKWARYMDFVSWDNYPTHESVPADAAFNHDLMRGLKQGKPFALMEQTPGVTNWHPYCKLKRPGVMRLWSYQAVAHGADTVMFFQMRRSIGACEKYHSAVIDHVGTNETRVFREIRALGEELEKIGSQTLGSRVKSRVAIVFDWDNWWAAELSAGPSKLINYHAEVNRYYKTLWKLNIAADIVSVEDDLSGYDLVIAPLLYMCKDGFDEKIRTYVKAGGHFVTTYFSGYVDNNDLVVTGGYPGRLKDVLGVWVEESDALPPEESNSFIYDGTRYQTGVLNDLMHLRGAKALASYESDFYKGMPVVTVNAFEAGKAYYVGTQPNMEFYEKLLRNICDELNITPVIETNGMVEIIERSGQCENYLFVLNHDETDVTIEIPRKVEDLLTGKIYEAGEKAVLESKDVFILKDI